MGDDEAWRRHKRCECVITPIYEEKDPGRSVDLEDIAKTYGVNVAQVRAARKVAKEVKRDIKRLAAAELDEIDNVLSSNSIESLSRPDKLKRVTSVTGNSRYVRQKSGYDFIEQVDAAQLRRLKERYVDSDVYSPDLLAERVRNMLNQDLTDDEAIEWLMDQWMRRDGLQSVIAGNNPKYVDIDALLPNDYEMRGFKLSEIFGKTADEAAGHTAQVLADEAKTYADRALGQARLGKAPYELDVYDYVEEVDYWSAVVGDEFEDKAFVDRAKARLAELAPRDIDDGRMNLFELWDEIRTTAIAAGRI